MRRTHLCLLTTTAFTLCIDCTPLLTAQGASATGGGAGGVGFIPVGAPSTAVITPGGGPSGPPGTAAPPPGGQAASGQAAPGGAPSGPGES